MMNDNQFSKEDKEWLNNFQAAATEHLVNEGFRTDLNIFKISEEIGFNGSRLHKDSPIMYAFWYILLSTIKQHISESEFKYKTLEEFLAAYPGWFNQESIYEKNILMQTANWMTILFKIIAAKKNKGLAIYVVPKVIEGWDVKYVTGSGQTRATANRVHIFESEGNTKPSQRGRVKTKKPVPVKGAGKKSGERDTTGKTPKRRKRSTSEGQFQVPVGSVADYQAKRRRSRNEKSTDLAHAIDATSASFVENFEQVAAKVSYDPKMYQKWSQAIAPAPVLPGISDTVDTDNDVVRGAMMLVRENSVFGLGLDLSRSNSYQSIGLSCNPNQQLNMPADYQRGFSWTEIPANPTPAPLIENDLQPTELANRKVFNPIDNEIKMNPFEKKQETGIKGRPVSPVDSIRDIKVLQPIQSQVLSSTTDAPQVNGSVMQVLTTSDSKDRLRAHPHTPFTNLGDTYKKVEDLPTENANIATKEPNLVSKEQLHQLFCGYDNSH